MDLASVSSHNDGFFCTDGFSRFTLDGRAGAGVFEVHELSEPAPWHRRELGLD